jgi:putative flippase GtrA
MAIRFTRYSALSLLTVPTGYALLLIARSIWDVNAGILNLVVGTVLTPPSFLLYRHFVWREGSGRGVLRDLFSFWQMVMFGALVSTVFIAAVDFWYGANGPLIVLAGLAGQGLVFVGRFVWLDLVTFSAKRRAARAARAAAPETPAPL